MRPALLLLGAALAVPSAALSGPALRGDVVAQRDVLTAADLLDDVPAALTGTALFRAPGLGQTGTIQAARLVEAAAALGLPAVDTGGRSHVTVTRAARRIGTAEIEAALARALVPQGIDPRDTGIVFDGAAPSLVMPPETAGALAAADVTYDRRTRRVAATMWVGPSAAERRGSLRVSGTAVDLVTVAVANRNLERGEAVRETDLTVERRAKDSVPSDALLDDAPLAGRVARRALAAGGLVRAGDLAKPELVAKGDVVTVLYQTPGMVLTMRAKATESGTLGDTVTVVNPGSRKVLAGTVSGPGRVSVGPAQTERVVALATPPASRP